MRESVIRFLIETNITITGRRIFYSYGRDTRNRTQIISFGDWGPTVKRYPYMARDQGFEPWPEALETSLYGFEDRCATITLLPYIDYLAISASSFSKARNSALSVNEKNGYCIILNGSPNLTSYFNSCPLVFNKYI